jgi:Superinfection immunity protein
MNDGLKDIGIIFAVLLALAVVIPLYFLPTIIARQRRLSQKSTIGWLNLFLGWTTAGWVVLVIFASLASRKQ